MSLSSETVPGSITLTSAAGDHQAHLRLVPGGPGTAIVQLFDPETNEETARPVVIKITDSGGKIAADFPGCNPDLVVVDSGGRITNG